MAFSYAARRHPCRPPDACATTTTLGVCRLSSARDIAGRSSRPMPPPTCRDRAGRQRPPAGPRRGTLGATTEAAAAATGESEATAAETEMAAVAAEAPKPPPMHTESHARCSTWTTSGARSRWFDRSPTRRRTDHRRRRSDVPRCRAHPRLGDHRAASPRPARDGADDRVLRRSRPTGHADPADPTPRPRRTLSWWNRPMAIA